MPPLDEDSSSTSAEQGEFRSTHWSVILEAGDSRSPYAAEAKEKLCRAYWRPLYFFVRRQVRDHEEARDMTQKFFARFIEKRFLDSVDLNKGRFRSFLLASRKHFLSNEWDKRRRLKRGGGCEIIPLDAIDSIDAQFTGPVDTLTPEKLFDRKWAEAVLALVFGRLRDECREAGNGSLPAAATARCVSGMFRRGKSSTR